MSEYGKLNWAQRANLKRSDRKRYDRIKTEHEREYAQLKQNLESSKTLADYKANIAKLHQFSNENVTGAEVA